MSKAMDTKARNLELMGLMRDGLIGQQEATELEVRLSDDPGLADEYLRFMSLHALLLRRRPLAHSAPAPLPMVSSGRRRWMPTAAAAAIALGAGAALALLGRLPFGNTAYAGEEMSVNLRRNALWVAALSVERGTLMTHHASGEGAAEVSQRVKPRVGLDRDRPYETTEGWVLVNFHDGAEAILQTGARIVPRTARGMDLVQGRVNIRTVNPARPFEVTAGPLRIQINGETALNRHADGTLDLLRLGGECSVARNQTSLAADPNVGRAIRIAPDGTIQPSPMRSIDATREWTSELTDVAQSGGRHEAGTDHLVFRADRLLPYDDQDGLFGRPSHVEILDEGRTIRLAGNCWKRLPIDRVISDDTVLEFEFRSGSQGELHGIGFDDDNSHRSGRTLFQLHGVDALWGGIYAWRGAAVGEWVRYSIPVGRFYTGRVKDLVLWADDDEHGAAESLFRNVRITSSRLDRPGTTPTQRSVEP